MSRRRSRCSEALAAARPTLSPTSLLRHPRAAGLERSASGVTEAIRGLSITLGGVLSDSGPKCTGKATRAEPEAMGLRHHCIAPRSPNHNGVCELLHGKVLRES